MSIARKLHNATLLADGKVLVTGGNTAAGGNNGTSANGAYATELWDPPPPSGTGATPTGTWSKTADIPTYRGYHSIALLLPDGKVLSAGGDFVSSAEIYSPPYLYNSSGGLATRPTITSVPASIHYGQSFSVGVGAADTIKNVTLLALGSVTHGFNMGQRISRLTFSQATTPGGALTVQAPASPNNAPPGYYMLFILNSSGVPSLAKIVQIPLTAPAAPTNLTATPVSSTQINLSWTDKSNNETGFKVERSTDGGASFTQIATPLSCSTSYHNTGLTSSTAYYYRVRAYNSSGNSGWSNTDSATTSP